MKIILHHGFVGTQRVFHAFAGTILSMIFPGITAMDPKSRIDCCVAVASLESGSFATDLRHMFNICTPVL